MSNEAIEVSLEAELDAFFGQYTAAGQAPGLVYGLVGSEGLSHWHGYGSANNDALVPDKDTIFPIASMTKSFIACAALIARDAKLISLNDPITAWVPEFTMDAAIGSEDPPTLEMLLSMSSGMTEDNSWVDPFIDLPMNELLDMVGQGVSFSYYPGAMYEYSNLGFTLAGLALARAVGHPLEGYVRQNVFEPLGLTSTFFDSELPAGTTRALGYRLDRHEDWVALEPKVSRAFNAAGGIMSSVIDLATWITWLGSAYRTPTEDNSNSILSRRSRREMQRIHISGTPTLAQGRAGGLELMSSGYGLGLRISEDLYRGTIVGHAGGLPGFKLYMTWHPVSGNGVVVLTNSHRGDPVSMTTQALSRMLERTGAGAYVVSLWPETLTMRSKVEALIRSWDERIASEIFAPNIHFDQPLEDRRAEIARLIEEVGALGDSDARIVSSVSPADITWSIPAERGELLCMVHLTPVNPKKVQEFVVRAVNEERTRATTPSDISPRRPLLAGAHISGLSNVLVSRP